MTWRWEGAGRMSWPLFSVKAMPISWKFAAMASLLIAALTLFMFLYFPARLKRQAMDAVVDKAESIAEMTAYSVSAALVFHDVDAAQEAFSGAQQNRDLAYLVVEDPTGKEFAAFNKDVAQRLGYKAVESDGRSSTGTAYRTRTPVKFNGRAIGMLYLGLSLEELEGAIRESRRSIALLSLILFICGLIVSYGSSVLATGPLRLMASAAREIAAGDLTWRIPVRSSDEVGRLAHAFNVMVDAVEERTKIIERAKLERLATLGQITATVSHELRNPLGTIRTSVFSIRERTKEKGLNVERALDRVERSLVRCVSIIGDLHEFTRGVEIDRKPTNLDSWMAGVLADQNVPTGIDVIKDLRAGIEIPLDQGKMIGVINNLVENAVQAIQSGQETDDHPAAVGRIEVSSRKDDSRAVISVADSGPGFPREDSARVFEPLFTTRTNGLGLGLSVVQKIVVLHGGTVSAESGRDGGATITLELPLELSAS